jgi:diguanylate cyclase (GGDEF)-like protein
MGESVPPRGENRRAIRNVAALVAVFLAGLWGGFGYWAYSSRQDAIAMTESGLLQMTHAVEQYVRNMIKMAEIFQVSAEHWLERNDAVNPCADHGFRALIEEFRQRTGGLIEIRLVTPSGDLFCFPDAPGTPLDNVADREYFQAAMRAPAGRRHVGIPVESRVTGQWRLPVTTRMTRTDHGFAVINASIDLNGMIETFESERPKPGGSISLWRDDGILLARAPHAAGFIGRQLMTPGSAQLEMITRHPDGVFLSRDAPIDGVERYVGHRRIGDLPAVVLVTATREDMLRPWRNQMTMAAVVLVVVSIWGALLCGQLVDALRRLGENTQELERLAAVDALTGLYNRRHLLETGSHELARMRRYGSTMALMLIDVDRFKHINDTWGHPTGDCVLRTLAGVMRTAVRDQDTLGRLGGEEFAAILPETDRAGAAAIAERTLAAVRDAVLATTDNGEPVKVTVSIGVTALNAGNDTFESALARADKALYRAKDNGRNRLEVG